MKLKNNFIIYCGIVDLNLNLNSQSQSKFRFEIEIQIDYAYIVVVFKNIIQLNSIGYKAVSESFRTESTDKYSFYIPENRFVAIKLNLTTYLFLGVKIALDNIKF